MADDKTAAEHAAEEYRQTLDVTVAYTSEVFVAGWDAAIRRVAPDREIVADLIAPMIRGWMEEAGHSEAIIVGLAHDITDKLASGALGVPADQWADHFEQWGSTVGSPPFTQEAVVAALRGPIPFGKAAGA